MITGGEGEADGVDNVNEARKGEEVQWKELACRDTDIRYDSAFEQQFRDWISECTTGDEVTSLLLRERKRLFQHPTAIAHAIWAQAKFGITYSPEPKKTDPVSDSEAENSDAETDAASEPQRPPTWRELCGAFASLCVKDEDRPPTAPTSVSTYAQTGDAMKDTLRYRSIKSMDDSDDSDSDVETELDFGYDNVEKFAKGPAVPEWIRTRSWRPRPLSLILALQALEMKTKDAGLDEDDLVFGAVVCSSVQAHGLFKVFLPQELATFAYALGKLSHTALRVPVLAAFDLFADLALATFPPNHVVTLFAAFRLTLLT